MSAASVVCATVPMVAFLSVVWWLDRYDREPIWLLGLTFFWGAIGSVLSAVIGSMGVSAALELGLGAIAYWMGFDPSVAIEMAGPTLVAPLVEEPCKAAFFVVLLMSRHFDNMTDGFVYGAAAGLGFGMTENLLYFVNVSSDAVVWGQTVVIRTFFSAVMHAMATSLCGAMLGFARFRGTGWVLAFGSFGLFLGMVVHAIWNGLLMLAQWSGSEASYYADLLILPAELVAILVIFELCLWEESFTIGRELQEEADNGIIPEEHPKIVASWWRRIGRSWLPAGVDHELYVQTATSLAMRKKQERLLAGRGGPFYRDEVARLRRQLELLLEQASQQ